MENGSEFIGLTAMILHKFSEIPAVSLPFPQPGTAWNRCLVEQNVIQSKLVQRGGAGWL
jgi:hypothetical protein